MHVDGPLLDGALVGARCACKLNVGERIGFAMKQIRIECLARLRVVPQQLFERNGLDAQGGL